MFVCDHVRYVTRIYLRTLVLRRLENASGCGTKDLLLGGI